jgi:hypothetical protein
VLDRPWSVDELEQWARDFQRTIVGLSFELKTQALEAELQAVAGVDEAAPYGSQAWYARTILTEIARARKLAADGHVDAALAVAMAIGAHHAEWEAKDWPAVHRGVKVPRNASMAGLASAKKRRNSRKSQARTYDREVRAYRKTHPEQSQNAAIGFVARQHGRKEDSVRQAIKRLKKLSSAKGKNRGTRTT